MAVIVIEEFMIQNLKLKGFELLAFAIIHGCTQKGDGCWHGGYDKLAEKIGSTQRSVILSVNSLVDRGLITKSDGMINGVARKIFQSAIISVDDTEKISESGVKKFQSGGEKISDNIKEKENNKKNKREKELESLVFPFSSERFIAAWNVLINEDKWRKKSVHALQLSLNKLAEYEEEFAIELMNNAIERGWQGVVFQDTPAAYEKWKAARLPKASPVQPGLLFENGERNRFRVPQT